jgi:hypothetical protein
MREPSPLSPRIWTAGPTLNLWFPSTGQSPSLGHTITLPNTPNGLAALVKILRDREFSSTPPTISTKGNPTQALAEALAKTSVKPWREDLPKDTFQALAELGL